MKILMLAALTAVIFNSGHGIAHADDYGFDFRVLPKKTSGVKKETGAEEITTEKWVYSVTVENKSFKDVPNIEIKYVMFVRPDPAGRNVQLSHVKLKRHEGTVSTAMLQNNDKFVFNTDEVELTGTELAGNFYWASGADPRAKDALKGLWLRVFVNGKQVAEYLNPPDLASRETWDAPPAQ